MMQSFMTTCNAKKNDAKLTYNNHHHHEKFYFDKNRSKTVPKFITVTVRYGFFLERLRRTVAVERFFKNCFPGLLICAILCRRICGIDSSIWCSCWKLFLIGARCSCSCSILYFVGARCSCSCSILILEGARCSCSCLFFKFPGARCSCCARQR